MAITRTLLLLLILIVKVQESAGTEEAATSTTSVAVSSLSTTKSTSGPSVTTSTGPPNSHRHSDHCFRGDWYRAKRESCTKFDDIFTAILSTTLVVFACGFGGAFLIGRKPPKGENLEAGDTKSANKKPDDIQSGHIDTGMDRGDRSKAVGTGNDLDGTQGDVFPDGEKHGPRIEGGDQTRIELDRGLAPGDDLSGANRIEKGSTSVRKGLTGDDHAARPQDGGTADQGGINEVSATNNGTEDRT